MRVLYTSFDAVPAPKGASVHIEAFVSALGGRHEVTLLTLKNSASTVFQIPGVRHIPVELSEPNYLERALSFGEAVEEHLEKDSYDVIHFRSIWEGLPACFAARRARSFCIYEVNGLPSVELKYHYPGVGSRQRLILRLQQDEKLCFNLADAIITPSRVTAQYIAEAGIDEPKICVIPNGVDTELFKPDGRSEANLSELLYVGTLAPWQGLETLFRAVRKLLGRSEVAGGLAPGEGERSETELTAHPEVRLTVCGGGRKRWVKDTQRLARKARIDDRVSFLGSVPPMKVPGVINAAGICISPLASDDRNTRQGCCPIKLLEYAACRKPICAPDLEVVTDLFEPEREVAIYRARSAHHLAQRIASLIEHPDAAAQMALNAYEKVRAELTWRKAGERLLALYESVPTAGGAGGLRC